MMMYWTIFSIIFSNNPTPPDMRSVYFLLLITLFFSCKKDNVEADINPPADALSKIIVNGKVSEEYEYKNGRLAKESSYFNCDTPRMIFNYVYDSNLLIRLTTQSRGMYSSSSTELCNPDSKFDERQESLKYDGKGQLVRRDAPSTYFIYERNAEGQVVSITQYFGSESKKTSLKYDSNGNLSEISGAANINGDPVRYEYDNQTNPYHSMTRFDNLFASPYHSPNNVIKAFDKDGKQLWERNFTYNSAGLPIKCVETNGLVYEYQYQ